MFLALKADSRDLGMAAGGVGASSEFVDTGVMVRTVLTVFVFLAALFFITVPAALVCWVRRSNRLIAVVVDNCAQAILAAAGVRLTVEGVEAVNSDEPMFLVGNHQSALDILILMVGARGRVRFIAKDALFRVPLWGWVLSRFGHVRLDRAHPRAAREQLDAMLGVSERHAPSFVVFPEGTRSPDGRLLPFRRGTMKICQRAGRPIVPFLIDGSGAVLPRNRLRVHPGPVRLCFFEPIPAHEVTSMSTAELHDRVRGPIAQALGQAPEADMISDAPMIATEKS